jgi:uncharacterized repeat protein (TIGR04138 family)
VTVFSPDFVVAQTQLHATRLRAQAPADDGQVDHALRDGLILTAFHYAAAQRRRGRAPRPLVHHLVAPASPPPDQHHEDDTTPHDGDPHRLTGQEIAGYFAELALQTYGVMVGPVLDALDLRTSESLGAAVFDLVRTHVLDASAEETMDDFARHWTAATLQAHADDLLRRRAAAPSE